MKAEEMSKIQRSRLRDIVDQILRYRSITRKELGESMSLSQASVSNYVATLTGMRLVREAAGAKSVKGRRSARVEFDPTHWASIAVLIDFGEIRGVLMDLPGTILEDYGLGIDYRSPSREIQTTLFTVITRLVLAAQTLGRSVLGIGIGVNDYVNAAEGIVYSYFNTLPWERIPLRDLVEEEFRLPTFLASTQHVGALGVLHYGNVPAQNSLLFVWLGRGVSMGIIVNGKLVEGQNGCAGELGHVVVEPDGKLCMCGNRGCLETLVSESAIVEQARQAILGGVLSELPARCGGDLSRLSIEHMVAAATSGDRVSCSVFDSVARILGTQLANLADILNPGTIVLRGPTIDNNTFLHESVQRVIRAHCLRKSCESLNVTYQKERDDIRLRGLGSLVVANLTQAIEKVTRPVQRQPQPGAPAADTPRSESSASSSSAR